MSEYDPYNRYSYQKRPRANTGSDDYANRSSEQRRAGQDSRSRRSYSQYGRIQVPFNDGDADLPYTQDRRPSSARSSRGYDDRGQSRESSRYGSSGRSRSSRGQDAYRDGSSSSRRRSGRSDDEFQDDYRSSGRRSTRSDGSRSRQGATSGRQRSQRDARYQQDRQSSRSRSSSRGRQDQGLQYPSLAQSGYGNQALFAPRRILGSRIVLIVAAVLAIALVVFLVMQVRSCATGPANSTKWGISVSQADSYTLNPTDLSKVPASSTVTTVRLGSDDADFTVGESQMQAVKDIADKIEKTAYCGFVFVDLDTGKGLAYNAGEAIYTAYAVKAPLVYYALNHPEEGEFSEYERTAAENAIVWGSADDFYYLGYHYSNDSYYEWLSSYGIERPVGSDNMYPSMSAAGLSGAWGEIYQYIKGTSSDQKWLSNLFATANTSYIRDTLKDDGATVLDNAGWVDDGQTDALTDAGVITKDGRTYLMVIITGLRDTDKGHDNMNDLIQALFDARGYLAPEMTLTYA